MRRHQYRQAIDGGESAATKSCCRHRANNMRAGLPTPGIVRPWREAAARRRLTRCDRGSERSQGLTLGVASVQPISDRPAAGRPVPLSAGRDRARQGSAGHMSPAPAPPSLDRPWRCPATYSPTAPCSYLRTQPLRRATNVPVATVNSGQRRVTAVKGSGRWSGHR